MLRGKTTWAITALFATFLVLANHAGSAELEGTRNRIAGTGKGLSGSLPDGYWGFILRLPRRLLEDPANLATGFAFQLLELVAPVPKPPEMGRTDDFRHFYGICWRGKPSDNLAFARQMGYEYVFYQVGMEKDPLAAGMNFFIESPEMTLSEIPVEIDIGADIPKERRESYESDCCWKSLDPFPGNLATGWPRNETRFTVNFDFQQRRVIDRKVAWALAVAKAIQEANPRFHFAGFAWDEANLHGEFWSHPHSRSSRQIVGTGAGLPAGNPDNRGDSSDLQDLAEVLRNPFDLAGMAGKVENLTYHPTLGPSLHSLITTIDPKASFHVPISYWTGSDSALLHPGITHEFSTVTDGLAAYYSGILRKARSELNPQAKWIVEPYFVFSHWVRPVERRSDADLLVPDMLCQERAGTEFVDDERIFASGRFLRNRVGITSPDSADEGMNRLMAAKAAVNGAWFNWYGRFGGSREGNMPNYQNIGEVPAWYKLIRVVPNWDNLTGVPLSERSWDGKLYRSANSQISEQLVCTRHPVSRKLFVVFRAKFAAVRLFPGERVVSVRRTDPLFREAEDGVSDLGFSRLGIWSTGRTRLEACYVVTLAR